MPLANFERLHRRDYENSTQIVTIIHVYKYKNMEYFVHREILIVSRLFGNYYGIYIFVHTAPISPDIDFSCNNDEEILAGGTRVIDDLLVSLATRSN